MRAAEVFRALCVPVRSRSIQRPARHPPSRQLLPHLRCTGLQSAPRRLSRMRNCRISAPLWAGRFPFHLRSLPPGRTGRGEAVRRMRPPFGKAAAASRRNGAARGARGTRGAHFWIRAAAAAAAAGAAQDVLPPRPAPPPPILLPAESAAAGRRPGRPSPHPLSRPYAALPCDMQPRGRRRGS